MKIGLGLISAVFAGIAAFVPVATATAASTTLTTDATFAAVPDFGFAGGGGSSSGGSGGFSGGSSYSSSSYGDSDGDGESNPVVMAIMLISFVIFVAFIFITNKNQLAKKASRNNSTPEEKWIHTEAARIFEAYQADWSAFNLDGIKKYTTPEYCTHASLMLELLKNEHRVNKVSQLKIHYVALLNHVDEKTELPANIRVEFGFAGLDEVIDTAKNAALYKQRATQVTETWNFVYDGKSLQLAGISQPTESAPHLVKTLADFAAANHLFYSPDWGRYALPARGLIFSSASMRVADVNNHIVGKWGDLLVQLYTYSPTPNSPNAYYIVGQITVPKDYLGVVVKSKKYKAAKKPDKSYDKFELEWNEFNARYDVYAAKRDALPAFELLNPKFMEELYKVNPSYNLEVADNNIYIFANLRHVTEKDYADLLNILKLAHKELER